MQGAVLGLFAKKPQSGQVKSRLAAWGGAAWAAEVAQAFLQDSVQRLAQVSARRVLAFAPADAADWFARLVQGSFQLYPQGPGDLGARLADFLTAQRAAGAERIVVVGADSPTLPLAYIEEAFNLLNTTDVVLGPALDGGYYLLGCGRRLPPIFEGISWGSAQVLEQTIARLSEPAWRLGLLPPWYDVDTGEQWQMLCGHLRALRRAGLEPQAPATEALAARGLFSSVPIQPPPAEKT